MREGRRGQFSSLLLILVALIGLVVIGMFVFLTEQNITYDAKETSDEIEVIDEDEAVDTSGIETGTWAIEEFVSNLVSGGVHKDGIPAIESPTYISVGEVDFLEDEDPVFVAEIDEEVKIFPQIIMVRHEIVNDVDSHGSISITYCPLSGSVIGYRGSFDATGTTFGVSGNLVNSNLVLYDRETESLWPQLLGRSISGENPGTLLETFPVWWSTWAAASTAFPDAQVLSKNTGYLRSYASDPYGSYQEDDTYYTTGGPQFPMMSEDDRLAPKDVVVGVMVGMEYLAIPRSLVKERGEVTTTLNGTQVQAIWDEELGTPITSFWKEDPELLGNDPRVVSLETMWFAWSAFYPNTILYTGEEGVEDVVNSNEITTDDQEL